MSNQQQQPKGLVHWKKNRNSNFLCGEDVKFGLQGVFDGMPVVITGHNETESFDQNLQAKNTVTVIYLSDLQGNPIKRGIVIGRWTLDFCKPFFRADPERGYFVDNWKGIKAVLWAKPDKRHGFVIRFKQYIPPVDIPSIITALDACESLEKLAEYYKALPSNIKNNAQIVAHKDELKAKFQEQK